MSRQALAALIAVATVLGQSEVSAQSRSPVARVPNAGVAVVRSPGHGLWQREHGWDGVAFTTESQAAVFDTAGSFVGGGCATSNGTRFELDS